MFFSISQWPKLKEVSFSSDNGFTFIQTPVKEKNLVKLYLPIITDGFPYNRITREDVVYYYNVDGNLRLAAYPSHKRLAL